ncbi:hypothetical protein D3C81_732480 [compost metagenome]
MHCKGFCYSIGYSKTCTFNNEFIKAVLFLIERFECGVKFIVQRTTETSLLECYQLSIVFIEQGAIYI